MINTRGTSPITMPKLDVGKPEVTMAPLIDVVFLLLIFFVVTTIFPENRGLIIEKPVSKHSEPLVMKNIIFVLNYHGEIYFKNTPVTVNDIERLTREQLIISPDSAILLHVDKRSTTESLIKLMDACKLGGAKRIGIATKSDEST